MANTDELLLIDLSSIAHPIWHMSQSEPDPNATSTKIVDRVRTLAAQHPHAAVCCDSGKSFRCEIDPTYKAQRPEAVATLHHQITLAREQLVADGFPVWAIKGFEADDLIASATIRALEIPDTTVLIASADKDLLQLVNGRVRALSTNNGTQYDAEAVKEKFGVSPEQMRDYLTLVGDTSDNVIGAKGIGPKRAVELLALFGSLDKLYAEVDAGNAKLTPSVAASLAEFRPRHATVRALITLRTDVDLPFEAIAAERVAKDVKDFAANQKCDGNHGGPRCADPECWNDESDQAEIEKFNTVMHAASAPVPAVPPATDEMHAAGERVIDALREESATGNGKLVVRQVDAAPVREGWELEPRTMRDAKALALDMFQSRMFSNYGHPAAVLSTILAGRELGMQSMASLRAFHVIEGKPTLAADLIRALVVRSGAAKYFRCTERTNVRATFETQRGDDPPIALSYTIEEALVSGRVKESSAYKRDPADVLVARASSKLARLVYADVVHGLYSPEEFD